ncbi:hypothetical protein SAFG77S_00854 [Streptomyces afghaniensis]
MRLLDITATAHPDGNRIDLSWRYPLLAEPPAEPVGVRVCRGRNRYPTAPDDGVLVAQGIGLLRASDQPLQGETTHYYTLFSFAGDPPVFPDDPQDDTRHNRAAAMALSPYDFGGLLYSLLPAIYHRYDAEKGQLRRFLDLPGAELDRLYNHVRVSLELIDPLRVDGRLLPLLAQWIGWQTDRRLPLDSQRNEIRFAPRIYQSTGGVHALDATVARITRWASRTKEFVHNVARTNQPERLNLWFTLRDAQGTWSGPALASLNFAHDGRPAVVPQEGDSALFIYHTRRLHGWDIWSKHFSEGKWQPSEPVVIRPGVDKFPTAARHGQVLRLFWQGRDPAEPAEHRRWRVWSAVRTGERWSEPTVFGDADTDRRMPVTTADDAGGLWLFWLEHLNGRWQLRYNRHDGDDWQLATPATLPPDGEDDPRVEDDLFLLFHPGAAAARLWLFWARQQASGEDQTRWHIHYRSKQGLDPSASDWSPVKPLARAAEDDHDRQPAALVSGERGIELFWSSTRAGGWTIFRNTLDTGSDTWGAAQQILAGPYNLRAPVAVATGTGALLVHRSNRSLEYVSTAFSATRTLDHRYAGTTTADTRARDRLALRGRFEDFQTYLYDSGPAGILTDSGRIARDTVGLYLSPRDTESPEEIAAIVSRLAGVLNEFMPVTARPVYITE